ncbi:MAG: DUF6326 family protein [Maritimibacter sp.]
MLQDAKLSLLWIFLFLNYIFCDVFSLMYPPMIQELSVGNTVDGIEMSQTFLLIFAAIMELGMIMTVLSRLLPYTPNRIANIVVGLALLVVQVGSLFAGENTLHYWFFSVVEISTLIWIVVTSWRWQPEMAK